jgi:hypothetical protein
MTGAVRPDWHSLAVAAAKRGDHGRAFQLLRRAILFDPGNGRATCDGFTMAERTGSPDAARLAAWSIHTHPVFLGGWRYRLDLPGRTAAREERQSVLKRVCVLSPGRGSDLAAAGQALAGLADHSAAAKILGWASTLLRRDVVTLFALAQSRFHARDAAGGLSALDRAKACGLQPEQDLFWRARLLMAASRHADADRVLIVAESLGGDIAERCRILGHTARPSDFRAVPPNE